MIESSSLVSLPAEMRVKILDYLSLSYLLTLQKVCRSFRDLIDEEIFEKRANQVRSHDFLLLQRVIKQLKKDLLLPVILKLASPSLQRILLFTACTPDIKLWQVSPIEECLSCYPLPALEKFLFLKQKFNANVDLVEEKFPQLEFITTRLRQNIQDKGVAWSDALGIADRSWLQVNSVDLIHVFNKQNALTDKSVRYYRGVTLVHEFNRPHLTELGLQMILSAAEEGFAPAQYYVSRMDPQISDEALSLCRLAAEQGYAPAQNDLGYLLSSGQSGDQYKQEGFTWYKKAAEQGDAFAAYSLGYHLCRRREASAEDKKEGFRWIKYAAKKGNQTAIQELEELQPKPINPKNLKPKNRGCCSFIDLSFEFVKECILSIKPYG